MYALGRQSKMLKKPEIGDNSYEDEESDIREKIEVTHSSQAAGTEGKSSGTQTEMRRTPTDGVTAHGSRRRRKCAAV
jgi:hypothetical protein